MPDLKKLSKILTVSEETNSFSSTCKTPAIVRCFFWEKKGYTKRESPAIFKTMKYKVKTIYSRKLIGKITIQYLIKSMGWTFYSAMTISAVIAVSLYLKGNRTILPAVFFCVFIFAVLIFLRMYSHFFSSANREFKKMKGNSSEVIFRENGISFISETNSIKWKDLYKVWSTDEAFLFFTSKDAYIICPTAGFDTNVMAFINEKLDEFRVKR